MERHFFLGVVRQNAAYFRCDAASRIECYCAAENNPNIRCHYIVNDLYELGITELMSPQGGTVRLYDKERCICDLIRDKEKIEMQLYSQALRDYFKSKPNNRKLLRYGKQFGIDDKIRTYMEVCHVNTGTN